MPRIRRLLTGALRRAALPVLPRRRHLPLRYLLHLLDGGCENELRHLDSLAPPGDTAIDVGANEGLFSYRLASRFARVYAFEVNDSLTKDLAAYNPGNITIVHEGLSSRQGDATLFIPMVRGRALTGWASLAPGNCPDTDEYVEKPVTISPLDRFELNGIAFVKIDVEGHEVEVLNGARRTLARNRPRVLLEVKPPNRQAVDAFFDQLNYTLQSVADLIGVPGSPENLFFVPGPPPDRSAPATD
jgi:FkbM family methyltransferase